MALSADGSNIHHQMCPWVQQQETDVTQEGKAVLEVFAELINPWDPLLSLRAHLQLLPIQAFPLASLFFISEHQHYFNLMYEL